ncbi:hypothetical protein DSCW_01340 [Desulfosarcina widdelii]|uniref:Uncharacterized protein n=1 Tax=Desulfosarcina widdelii TaxID=947919 RepID=A0A5K7Z8A7_9BACT|nr:hypothetical protein [Desulfosarcina widdelii]BBO72717.1 hypothetical protein DSCW_01340 [Desulfosarcina widdelii]
MVLKNRIEDFIEIIGSIDWFCRIGSNYIFDNKNLKYANSKKNAQSCWISESFEEASSVAWEAFRQVIVTEKKKLKYWEKSFNKCHEKLIKTLSTSESALKLISSLNQDVDEFASKLPFLGAVGEIIVSDLKPEYDFFTTQIPLYIEGVWVCGWEGKLNSEKFVYPKKNFIIY